MKATGAEMYIRRWMIVGSETPLFWGKNREQNRGGGGAGKLQSMKDKPSSLG